MSNSETRSGDVCLPTGLHRMKMRRSTTRHTRPLRDEDGNTSNIAPCVMVMLCRTGRIRSGVSYVRRAVRMWVLYPIDEAQRRRVQQSGDSGRGRMIAMQQITHARWHVILTTLPPFLQGIIVRLNPASRKNQRGRTAFQPTKTDTFFRSVPRTALPLFGVLYYPLVVVV